MLFWQIQEKIRNCWRYQESFALFPFLIKFSFGYNSRSVLQKELQSLEDEEIKKFRGFREVIDLISASQKPVISHNCLNGVSLEWKFLSLVLVY